MSSAREEGAEKNIHVEISGSAETRYAARWTITGRDGEQRQFEETGEVPASYAYSGDAIAGEVRVLSDSGRLEVEIRKSGNRSRSATQGKGSVIRIHVR